LLATTADRSFTEHLEKERLLNLEIAAVETQFRQTKNQEGKDTAAKRLDQLRSDRKSVQTQITRRYPRYADLKTPGRLRIEDIQKELAPQEAALSYFVSPQQTALWIVSRDQAVCILVPLTRKELVGKSEAFRRSFGRILDALDRPAAGGGKALRAAFQFPVDQAYDLYRTLVAPAEKIIRTKKTVYVAPDDLLYKLPFEALLARPFTADAGERIPAASLREAPFWVKTQSLAYLPSLSVLRSLRAFGKEQAVEQDPLAAFADPDFSAKGKEAGGTAAPATGATRAALLRAVSIKPKGGSQWLLPPLPDTRDEALSVAALITRS
jgi:hypothetical protein